MATETPPSPPELSSRERAELRAKAQTIDTSLNVGKAGITDTFVDEVRALLKREGLVKVRLLKSALEEGDRRDLGRELADRTGSALVEVRGHTVVLYKP